MSNILVWGAARMAIFSLTYYYNNIYDFVK